MDPGIRSDAYLLADKDLVVKYLRSFPWFETEVIVGRRDANSAQMYLNQFRRVHQAKSVGGSSFLNAVTGSAQGLGKH